MTKSLLNFLTAVANPIWKIPVVIIAIITGAIGATQAGFSGAEYFLRLPWQEIESPAVVHLLLVVGAAMTCGSWYLVQRIAKPALFIMAPILLYSALVLGVWDGFWSDFDTTRLQAMKHGWANAYALEHMSDKGRKLTCRDGSHGDLELTDDAASFCYALPGWAPDWDRLSDRPPKGRPRAEQTWTDTDAAALRERDADIIRRSDFLANH